MIITDARKKSCFSDDNLIPLINVVFLMLIFFMVAGHIEKKDAVKIRVPNSVSEMQQAEGVTVLLTAYGEVYVDGEALGEEQMLQALRRELQQSENPQDLKLLLRVSHQLPVSQLQEFLKLIKKSGFLKVSLITQHKPA